DMPTSTCIGHIAAAAYFGPMDADAAAERCRGLLEEVEDRPGNASVAAHLGGLEAMRGRVDAGLELLASARAIYTDLGWLTSVARTCAPIEAETARWAGDDERARVVLDESCEFLREQGNWSHFGAHASDLAAVLCALGLLDEAREVLDSAAPHILSNDVFARIAFGTATATLLVHEGERADAIAAAREVVALAEQTDASNRRAAAQLSLAVAAREQEPLARALALYEEKGNAAAAARLRAGAAASLHGTL